MAAVVALHCHCHASQQKGEKKILAFFFFLFVVLGGFRHCPAAPGTIRHGGSSRLFARYDGAGSIGFRQHDHVFFL